MSFRLPAMISGVAPSSRSLVPMSSTTAAGSSESTSSCSRSSTPRRGVAVDAAVGHLDAGEGRAEAAAPALGDGVAEEDDGAPVLFRRAAAHAERRARHTFWNQS